MKKVYECIFIFDKDISQEFINEKILNHFNNVKELEHWGVRKLAFPIKKETSGYYLRFIFSATDREIDELYRLFDNENETEVLKYIFVVLDTSDTNYYESRLEFEDSLEDILDTYTENTWRDDPLTDKEIETLVKHLEHRLKFMCGTITEYEYRKLEG